MSVCVCVLLLAYHSVKAYCLQTMPLQEDMPSTQEDIAFGKANFPCHLGQSLGAVFPEQRRGAPVETTSCNVRFGRVSQMQQRLKLHPE